MKLPLYLLVIAAIAVATSAQAAGTYFLTDLGTTADGAHAFYTYGINSSGQVVGQTDVGGGDAFLWTPTTPNSTSGTLVDLGGNITEASAINDSGQVVGCYSRCHPSQFSPSQLWTPTVPNGSVGAWTSLPSRSSPAGVLDGVRGINADGQVVGTIRSTFGAAGLWSPSAPNGVSGSTANLGVAAAQSESEGWGINARGQIVGTGNIGFSDSRATLWSPTTPNGSTGAWITLLNVPSWGSAINASGQVAGTNDSARSLFLWSPTTPNGTTGTVTDLGRLSSGSPQAMGMNSGGSIVGYEGSKGFLWEPSTPNGTAGAMIDLTTLLSPSDAAHWQLAQGRGINDRGQIVGWGKFDADGPGRAAAVTRGFLLTPTIAGDFNGSGTVDAADYVMWRCNNGSAADYDLWRAHFGQSISGGGASVATTAVPEPATIGMFWLAAALASAFTRKSRPT